MAVLTYDTNWNSGDFQSHPQTWSYIERTHKTNWKLRLTLIVYNRETMNIKISQMKRHIRDGTWEREQGFHALSRLPILSTPPHMYYCFYAGLITEAWLIKSSAFGNWTQSPVLSSLLMLEAEGWKEESESSSLLISLHKHINNKILRTSLERQIPSR